MGTDWLLPVFGLVVGLLVGLTGMGGGVLMTPLLVLGLGMPATAAVGTDLAYSTVTKLAGAWQHWRQGTVNGRLIRSLAVGSVPSTVAAVGVLFSLQGTDKAQVDAWLKRGIGGMLGIAAVVMLCRVRFGAGGRPVVLDGIEAYPTVRLVAIGAFGAFVVGLTSIGSGSLIIALLVMTFSRRPECLIGTDVPTHCFWLAPRRSPFWSCCATSIWHWRPSCLSGRSPACSLAAG